jgi:hypothetical protein
MDRLTVSSRPDLVFELVGAGGTNLKAVTRALRSELARVDYAVEEIYVSALLHHLDRYADLNDKASLFWTSRDNLTHNRSRCSERPLSPLSAACRTEDRRLSGFHPHHVHIL